MKRRKIGSFGALMIVLCALIVAVALFWKSGSAETVPVVLPTPAAGGQEQNGTSEGVSVVRAEVTPRTVQAVIARMSRPDSYSRTLTVEDFWSGGSAQTVIAVYAKPGAARLRITGSGSAENVLLADGTLTIWYDDASSVFVRKDTDTGTQAADLWLRSLTYEDLLSVPTAEINGAGYTEYGGEACVWAEYTAGSFGYRNKVYVSAASGLLMGAETWDGETLVYSLRSDAPVLAEPDQTWFTPPAAS